MYGPDGHAVLIPPITEIVRLPERRLLLSAKDLAVRARLAVSGNEPMPRKAPPSASRAERLPSAHGAMSRLAYARAKGASIALNPLLRQAGLTRQQLDNPGSSITVRDQIKFLNLAAAALQNDLLGFHIAQMPDLRAIGLLYYLLASSETLLDGVQRIARYSTIVNEGITQTCTHGTEFSVSFRYKGVGRHLDRPRSSARVLGGRAGAAVPRAHGSAACSLARAAGPPAGTRSKGRAVEVLRHEYRVRRAG